MRRIIDSYLTERIIKYRDINGKTKIRSVTVGVPQGSVLGLLLWCITYDAILRTALQGENEIICFADDTLIILVGDDTDEITEYFESEKNYFKNVVKAIRSIGLEISPSKTEAVFFGERNKNLPTIRMGDTEIKATRHMKYLGIIIDSRWAYYRHFNYAKEKALKVARALEKVMPNLRGPSQNRRKLYVNVILSVILYAAPVWFAVMLKSK